VRPIGPQTVASPARDAASKVVMFGT
jgi:hypothetical protein